MVKILGVWETAAVLNTLLSCHCFLNTPSFSIYTGFSTTSHLDGLRLYNRMYTIYSYATLYKGRKYP